MGASIHLTAIIDPTVEIGPGSVAFAGVVVQADGAHRAHVILDANATVSHDCVLEDYVHLCRASTWQAVCISKRGRSWESGRLPCPAFASARGPRSACCAAVTADLPDHVVAVGCPAKVIKSIQTKPLPSGVDYR